MKKCKVKDILIGTGEPLCLISGPCVIESEEHTLRTAQKLKEITASLPIRLIFKASYDKGNRSSIHSFRGPGLQEGLRILEKVQKELDLPVTTDIHSPEEAVAAGQVCDIIQIPAFLCRQTDLVIASAKASRAVSVKKGQFMAPWDMQNVTEKISHCGNDNILLIDRGTTFGYNNLVSDMRSIPIMQGFGFPVCFDASHSVQLPGGLGSSSGGQRQFIPTLAQASIAAGANCIFMESHPSPAEAKSDSATVFDLKELPALLHKLIAIYQVVNKT